MPGVRRKPLAGADNGGGYPPVEQLAFLLTRDDRRPLQRHALGHHDRITHLRARRRHQPVFGDFAQHRPSDKRPVDPVCHLGMAADQRHVERCARLGELREQSPDDSLVGDGCRQQYGREEPARRGATHRDVVGIHRHRVPAQLVGGERHRVRGGHEVALAEIDNGGILAHARTDYHTRIVMIHVRLENGLE